MNIFEKYDLVDVDESFPIPDIPKEGLILIVGTSGTGKSTIIKNHYGNFTFGFNQRPIYQNFTSEENAEKFLISCGLRTIPAWKRPYHQLSNGEQHRAFCALSLDLGIPYIDEFTSVIDRPTAKALSFSIQKSFRSGCLGEKLCIATCHRDVIDWLNPDHIYDTDLREWVEPKARGLLHRPKINLSITSCNGQKIWNVFKRHHYLSSKFNKSSNAFICMTDDKIIGFTSIVSYPSGSVKNAWRGHRTVILPEFQGLGIGTALSDTIGQMVIDSGGRYFSKTSHPAFGLHRERSSLWKPTSKNKKARNDYSTSNKTKEDGHKMMHRHRVCYSHEYKGY